MKSSSLFLSLFLGFFLGFFLGLFLKRKTLKRDEDPGEGDFEGGPSWALGKG